MPTEDDAVTVAIDEPYRAVEEGAAIGLGSFQGERQLGGGVRGHALMMRGASKTFHGTTHELCRTVAAKLREIPENQGAMSGCLKLQIDRGQFAMKRSAGLLRRRAARSNRWGDERHLGHVAGADARRLKTVWPHVTANTD